MAAGAIRGALVPWHLPVGPTSAVRGAGSDVPAWVCLSAAFWEQDALLTPLVPWYVTQSGNKNQI